jgi:hypothetical protein
MERRAARPCFMVKNLFLRALRDLRGELSFLCELRASAVNKAPDAAL